MIFDKLDLISEHMIFKVSPIQINSEILSVPPIEGLRHLLLQGLLLILIRSVHKLHHLLLELLRVLLLVLLQTCGYDFDCDSPRVSDGSTGGGALTFKQSSRSTQAPSTTVGMGTSRIVN